MSSSAVAFSVIFICGRDSKSAEGAALNFNIIGAMIVSVRRGAQLVSTRRLVISNDRFQPLLRICKDGVALVTVRRKDQPTKNDKLPPSPTGYG
jgi:hypothetical protein